MRHRADRHRRHLGLRPGRPDDDPQRDPARGQRGHRDRPSARAAVDGGSRRRHDDQLRGGEHGRPPQRAHRRQGTREMHRRRRSRSPRDRVDRRDVRPRQAGDDAGDRPSACAARDDLCLPAGRHLVDSRRLWRAARQNSVRRADEQGPDGAHRPDPRQPLERRSAAPDLEDEIDPSFVITHKVALDQGPEMYKAFRDKQDGCIKVMLTP